MADQQDAAVILALIQRQATARRDLAARVEALIRRLLAAFDGWYDDNAVRALSERLATVVRSAQVLQGGVSGQFQQQVLQVLNADERRPDPITLPDSLRGLSDPTTPYQRPMAEYRRLRAEGKSPTEARDLATGRAVQIAKDDLSLANREAARQRLAAADKVIGWRRVIHPEMSHDGTCGLCLVASDRVYHRGDLMPIHTGCACEALPVTKAKDPGQSLNEADFRRLYGEAGSTKAADLRKVRIKTRHHGELGPILTDARHRFRTETQVEADQRTA